MSKQVTRRPTKQDLRKERREEQIRREAERKRREQRRRVTIISAVVAVLVSIGALVAFIVYNNTHGQSQTNQARPIVNPQYPPVDNAVYCDQQEQLAYHIHAHLTMYIDGQNVPLPAQIGIASDQSCLYWLHTHDTSGVIHMEAPINRTFMLGNFLDEWSTEFPSLNYPPQLDQTGWQVYVNGKLYKGDFHKISLESHTLITMAYNTSHFVPDTTYNWNGL